MKFKACDESGKLEFSGERTITKVRLSVGYIKMCSVCNEWHPLELRQTEDGVVRDQPYCSECRNAKSIPRE